MVKYLLSLNNELLVRISYYLDFYSKYKLSKTQKEIRGYIICDRVFIHQYQSHASNIIKFWWLSRKIGNDTICIIKNNNIVDNDIIDMVIDNFICTYDPGSLTNKHYHLSCKEFNQTTLHKSNSARLCDCLSDKVQHNEIRRQFVTLCVHPFIILYLKNKYNESVRQFHNCLNYEIYIKQLSDRYRIVRSDDIHYNILNYKKILLSLV